MADKALSSASWIARQNAEREARNKSARQKAEDMSEGETELANLDTGNREILEASLKNLDLTDEAFRGKKWHKKYDKIQGQLAALDAAEKKAES